jgi:hypothetical protein
MTAMPERRRSARLFVPRHLGGLELELRQVHLLDLSATGARIEHRGHLHEGLVCFVDLPRPFGRLRLTGRVVWTRLHKGEQTLDGDKHLYYQSGLAFTGITPEQQSALADVLETFRAATDAPGSEPSG